MYTPVWAAIKADRSYTAELEVLPQHVARVKKAISKEKGKDKAVAFLNLEEGNRLKLHFSYDKRNMVLKVWVTQTFGLEDLKL